MSTIGGCRVQLSGDAGTGRCDWEPEGRTGVCSAHRKRKSMSGSYQADRPVRRLPTREPSAVAQRLAARAAFRRRVTAALV